MANGLSYSWLARTDAHSRDKSNGMEADLINPGFGGDYASSYLLVYWLRLPCGRCLHGMPKLHPHMNPRNRPLLQIPATGRCMDTMFRALTSILSRRPLE